MLAVKAGKSSPAGNYTAQHWPTARSSRRCAAPPLPALSWPGHPLAPCGRAHCGYRSRLDVPITLGASAWTTGRCCAASCSSSTPLRPGSGQRLPRYSHRL